jgi:predicted PhzF superfamily epimerase YddE/YHI9
VYRARDLLVVFDTQEEVESLRPDFHAIGLLDTFAVIASAPGQACDFVSRFFAPKVGIPEDPATGSSHCTLVPYWSERLGKTQLHALQLSRRRGEIFCAYQGEQVEIAGRVVEYLRGHIFL